MPNLFNKKCGLSDTTSLFDKSLENGKELKRQDLMFMTEFSRFMNHKAPELLQVKFAEQFILQTYYNDVLQREFLNINFDLLGILS